jgi:hypothetical protein
MARVALPGQQFQKAIRGRYPADVTSDAGGLFSYFLVAVSSGFFTRSMSHRSEFCRLKRQRWPLLLESAGAAQDISDELSNLVGSQQQGKAFCWVNGVILSPTF